MHLRGPAPHGAYPSGSFLQEEELVEEEEQEEVFTLLAANQADHMSQEEVLQCKQSQPRLSQYSALLTYYISALPWHVVVHLLMQTGVVCLCGHLA